MIRKKTFMKIIFIILAALAVLLLLIALFMASFVTGGKRQTLEEARLWQSEHYDLSWYDGLDTETYTVSGKDGYVLHVQLCKNPVPTGKYVILSHGYTDNRFGSLKYTRSYLDLGYHCIIYDLRGHGENAAACCTYGIREAEDLLSLIEDTKTRYPGLTELGLHGESLGAATTLTCLKYAPDVQWAVADCPFSSIEDVLKHGYRSYHLPSVLYELSDLGCRLRFGFSLSDARPVDALSGNTVPVLLIHGAGDSFILPEHSRVLQAATSGYSELHLIDGAGHAQSVLTSPETYAGILSQFLEVFSNEGN